LTILERKLAGVELKNDEGNEFQRKAVRDKKFCLDAKQRTMGMMILRLWPLVIDGSIWRRWGESAILYMPETME